VLLPSKYGGYVQAMDLSVPETLAWYSYGLHGIDMPIPHHIAAMPSADPYKGFDFYQTMQPPASPYVNENSPEWRNRGDFKMFKMRYDGSGKQNSISVVNDIGVTTGMSLGVHVSIGVGENANKWRSRMARRTWSDHDISDNLKTSRRSALTMIRRPAQYQPRPPMPPAVRLRGPQGHEDDPRGDAGEEFTPADLTAVFGCLHLAPHAAIRRHPDPPSGCAIIDTRTWKSCPAVDRQGFSDNFPLVKQTGFTGLAVLRADASARGGFHHER
jgi:hypothetical protein